MDTDDNRSESPPTMLVTRGYQQEMLEESLKRNIIIALDTGSGKTLIAVLRLKHEMEREPVKLSWFIAPTVALCDQQKAVIEGYIPVSVGLVSGANEPDQWKNAGLWERVLRTHRIMVSTPQVFLDALRHGYIALGRDISLLVFDEAHHAVDNHPYNRLMVEFYFDLPNRENNDSTGVVRPMILGLTASPIYGGNVAKAFQIIERNLDCTIRAPRLFRSELAQHVYRPVFKHIMYYPSDTSTSFSTNHASLEAVLLTMDIENDPYVANLRQRLAKSTPGMPDYTRFDQKLSKVVSKSDSFTHKGMKDFNRTAAEICQDLGAWAADWFVWKVIERAKQASQPYNKVMVSWRVSEKEYLLSILEKVIASPVSYYPEDIADDCSDKVKALIECLLMEKAETESLEEVYSCIVFVQRRDSVLALAEVLKHHPQTKGIFNIGILLGTSDSAHRHSMMDITRSLVKESQEDTLSDFRLGEKNLVISTAVAEEGIDIQACGSVIRWDPPQNMASWAQSRGRARKQRSTFTVMFEEGSEQQSLVAKWENLEREMVRLINDPSRDLDVGEADTLVEEIEDDEEEMCLEVASTGAQLTLHSAVSHLSHFCAVIPNSTHVDNRPLFERDPHEFPDGWHSLVPGSRGLEAYAGPYGSRVTLPRTLPLPQRQFSVDRKYDSVVSAHRHSAFEAYRNLYEHGLLNDNLLPITSLMEPELEDDVKAMLADVEKREGMAIVSINVDPWAADEDSGDIWECSVLTLEGLAPLLLFTKSEPVALNPGPTLYRPGRPPMQTSLQPLTKVSSEDAKILLAREFTRTVFWALNGVRMVWEDLDFSYLFLPMTEADAMWSSRRSWLDVQSAANPDAYPHRLMVKADKFVREFGYAEDLTLIQKNIGFGRPFKFVGWKHDFLSTEEEETLKEQYSKLLDDVQISYPLLVVEAYPPRTNLLFPLKPKVDGEAVDATPRLTFLLPEHSGVILLSRQETEYSFVLPSFLRSFYMAMTANSLRRALFLPSPLADIPLPLLVVAITAPSSGERLNYQRLETLGDAVLKFLAGIQLMAEYPLWHEGYLTKKKDHAVSNVRLAKEDIKRGVYKWIIRDVMLGKKWKPKYFHTNLAPKTPIEDSSTEQGRPPKANEEQAVAASEATTSGTENVISTTTPSGPSKPKRKPKKNSQQLSTKVLADVVESIIGAAYYHGGLRLGYDAVKFFDLGLKWEPIPDRINQILSRVDSFSDADDSPMTIFPPQINDVEKMLGYVFTRKLLLIEALTHASYQQDDSRTPSYERLEFLGDSILDLVVNDYLFHAPGKNYTPGHIFLRKAAVVNAHILAYVCLNLSTKKDAYMPQRNPQSGAIEEARSEEEIFFFKCLFHSSPMVFEDQLNTFTRFGRRKAEIEEALTESGIFPWAALTRLQAPKFFSDMVESVIGAVFLDSGGSMDAVKDVIGRLGIMGILERIVLMDVDVLHPISRLSLWSQKNEKEIEYRIGREGRDVFCRVLVDGAEVDGAKVVDQYRGKVSQDEVKFSAAEAAIKVLKLRDVGVSYELLKKKKRSKPKKKRARDTQEEGA